MTLDKTFLSVII